MRKIWLACAMMLMVLPLMLTKASAASVTDVHWVTRNDAPIPFVRLVLSLTNPVEASASIEEDGLSTTVTLKKTTIASNVNNNVTMDSSIASKAVLQKSGADTKVIINTPKSIDVQDVKVFSLKKDLVNNKPYRMVIDIQKKGVAPRENYYGKNTVVGPALNTTASPKLESTVKALEPAQQALDKSISKDAKAKAKAAAEKAKKQAEEAKKQAAEKAKQAAKAAAPAATIPAVATAPAKASSGYRTTGGIAGKTIVIDPGHGGSDSGAIGPSGLQEKQVTLPVSQYLKEMLEAKGAKVILTRSTDVDVYGPNASGPDELQARVNVANYNNADAFISVHINSFVNPSVAGIATYYFDGSTYSKRLASAIQDEIAEEPDFGGSRGIQPANFYVLRHSTMPAVLVELGFISNPKEENLLKTAEVRKDFAKRILDGFATYFGG